MAKKTPTHDERRLAAFTRYAQLIVEPLVRELVRMHDASGKHFDFIDHRTAAKDKWGGVPCADIDETDDWLECGDAAKDDERPPYWLALSRVIAADALNEIYPSGTANAEVLADRIYDAICNFNR